HLALESGPEQVRDRVYGPAGHLGGVIADGHEAAVVGEPKTRRLLKAVRDVSPRGHLVRSEDRGVLDRDTEADVDYVGRAIRAGQLVDRVDLLLAPAV